MQEQIAKRYINGLKQNIGNDNLETVCDIFASLSLSFSDKACLTIMESPIVSSEDKKAIVLEAVKSAKSDALNNMISLLAEKNRLNLIPSIAKELKKELDRTNKIYSGTIFSDSDIDKGTLAGISAGLSKKVDATINLEFVKNDFDGIKVEVEGLGVEINFSKARLNSQLIEHILKAI